MFYDFFLYCDVFIVIEIDSLESCLKSNLRKHISTSREVPDKQSVLIRATLPHLNKVMIEMPHVICDLPPPLFAEV